MAPEPEDADATAVSGTAVVPTVRVAVATTVLFALTQVAATVAPDGVFGSIAVVFSLVLFAAGSVAFLWAFFVAAGRSRDEQVTLAGVIWLTGAAPTPVVGVLRSVLIAQVAIALVTAVIRPFTAVAFGILAPMFGLGCLAWFGARHGTFAPIEATTMVASRPGGEDSTVARAPKPSAPTAGEPTTGQTSDESLTATHRDDEDRSDPDDFDQLFRRRRRRRR